MRLRRITRHALALIIALAFTIQFGDAQAQATGGAQALQDYEETVRQADALAAAGNAFEAVRLYERAGRVAYNNKLATDSAALNTKLAAARSARDAKATAVPTPPPAASATVQSASAPAASSSVAGAASTEDANAWIEYGDGLARVSEYGDAVRAYERARRIAVNNRVPYDRAALDAKIAAAAKAHAAPRAATELIPEPLPPLPREPGAEPEPPYLRDRPGKLRPWAVSAVYSKAEMHVTDAELKAFDANLRRVMVVLAKAPVLSPPTGFEFDVSATLSSFEDVKERQRYVAARLPLRGYVRFSSHPYLEIPLRSKSTGAASVGAALIATLTPCKQLAGGRKWGC